MYRKCTFDDAAFAHFSKTYACTPDKSCFRLVEWRYCWKNTILVAYHRDETSHRCSVARIPYFLVQDLERRKGSKTGHLHNCWCRQCLLVEALFPRRYSVRRCTVGLQQETHFSQEHNFVHMPHTGSIIIKAGQERGGQMNKPHDTFCSYLMTTSTQQRYDKY